MSAPARFPRPPVVAQLGLPADTLIEASAGTGKTFTLEHLVLEFVLVRGLPLSRLLVVTFTDKATRELKSRLRERFEALRAATDPLPDLGPDEAWTLDAPMLARVDQALAELDGAPISTLHGFCKRTLSRHAFQRGRPLQEELIGQKQLVDEAFDELLRRELARRPEDLALLRRWLGTSLETSDAGEGAEEGRARTLDSLRAWLAEVRRERRPLLPATQAASLAALRKAFAALEPETLREELKAAGLHANTAKAQAERVELALAVLDGPDPADRWMDDGSLRDWAAELEEKLEKKGGEALRPLAAVVGRAHAAMAARSLHVEVARAWAPRLEAEIQARAERDALFDYDQLLTRLDAALVAEPTLAARIRAEFDVALIDEFQDTDEVQWRVFCTLFGQARGVPLYLVGDPKQAIYAFRGADLGTYLAARKTLREEGAREYPLTRSYRSSAALCRALDLLFRPGAVEGSAPFFETPGLEVAEVRAGRQGIALIAPNGSEAPPVVAMRCFAALPIPSSNRKPKLSAQRALTLQIQAVVAELRELFTHRWRLRDDQGQLRQVGPGDVFVLVATRREADAVAVAFRAAGLPVALFKQGGLHHTPEAGHLRDVLRAVLAPDDGGARLRAWTTPFFGLSLEEAAQALEATGDHPLVARLDGWNELARKEQVERLVEELIEEQGYAVRQRLLHGSERALTNVRHLGELLVAAVRGGTPLERAVRDLSARIDGALDDAEEGEDLQRLDGERDAVQVMTMHVAKGLERPLVFALGGLSAPRPGLLRRCTTKQGERAAWMGPRAPPEIERAIEREALEEQRRLAYVALTRPSHRLYLPFQYEEEGAPARSEGIPEGHKAHLDSNGPQGAIAARLAALHPLLEGTGDAALFEHRDLSPEPIRRRAPRGAPAAGSLEPLLPDPEIERLRQAHRGFTITSYSALSARAARELAADEGEGRRALDASRDAPLAPVGPDELPSGRDTGVFVHALIEELPLAEVERAASPEALLTLPRAREVAERLFRLHGIAPGHRAHALRLAFRALRLPLGAAGRMVEAPTGRLVRELAFHFPLPEPEPVAARLREASGVGFPIGRGAVKGFIDAVVERDGRAFWLDWKTDLLPAFDKREIEAHVAGHYDLQVRLYSVALKRLLGLRNADDCARRFGGGIYVFLRGLDPAVEGAGVHAVLPAWEQLQRWEHELEVLSVGPEQGSAARGSTP